MPTQKTYKHRSTKFLGYQKAAELRCQNLEWTEVAFRLGVSVWCLYDNMREIRRFLDPKLPISKKRARAARRALKAKTEAAA
jgi:hypothetical protein